jgi:DNA-directed RNA polymerase subunit RPC12/RpoP
MTDLPSINYVCSHCGATATFHLVPAAGHGLGTTAAPREIPSIDFRCLRCGAVQTYMLVPENVQTPAL